MLNVQFSICNVCELKIENFLVSPPCFISKKALNSEPSSFSLKRTHHELVHSLLKFSFMRKLSFVLVILFINSSSYSQAGREQVRVTDMLKIKSIGGITLSNDGSKAVF